MTNIDDVWECDLLQLTTIKEHNDGYCYLLVVVDVLSKQAWVEPLREKTTVSVTAAFARILKRSEGRVPVLLQSDKGKEFVGSTFQTFLKKHSIKFRTARNPDIKAAVVERLNRTIRERMWRYFSHKSTKRYIDEVQSIIDAYNHTRHSGTKMRPCDVNIYNAAKARENLEKRARLQSTYKLRKKMASSKELNKYKPGSYVRISRTKNTFEKGYEKNFSEEVFKIKRISNRQNLPTFILEDLNGEEIDGFFYLQELAHVGAERMSSGEQFKIERVIRTKGRGPNKQLLVKWTGYPDKFNSWIKASEVAKI